MDALDQQLLSLLRQDARTSVAILARKLGVSRGTVGNRIAKLEDAGTIVGFSLIAGNSAQHAFLFQNGQLLDLNSLVTLSDTFLTQATAINDLGQIVANGADGQAYLLTPIPEPSTYAALLAAAVFGLVALRRRRGV
jgi:probable HAF family extracellular repeat protein